MPCLSGHSVGGAAVIEVTVCSPGEFSEAMQGALGQPQQVQLRVAEARAILDTGATNTAVSKRLAEQLQLVPIGKTKVLTAAGQQEVNTYQVDILVPFGSAIVPIERLPVTEFDAPSEEGSPQVLLGMDVIQKGCLTIDFQGKWTFSL